MYIEDRKLKSDNFILDKTDLGYFDLEKEILKDEKGKEYNKYTYNNGMYNLPYVMQEIDLADSILDLEDAKKYYYEVTEEYYNSEEFKQELLKKYISNINGT